MLHSDLYKCDLKLALEGLPAEKFHGKRIFVTGATGMLCSCVVDLLLEMRSSTGIDVRVIAAGRDRKRLQNRFHEPDGAGLQFFEYDATLPLAAPVRADYLIHGASHADPVHYSQYPVETMLTNLLGTKNLIEMGMKNGMQRFLYVSSGEFYGQPDAERNDFTETYNGALDYSSPRACYPSGKRAAEVLCQCYHAEYFTDCVIVRPCHLFGPTMLPSDSRAVSEFLRNALGGNPIVMKSAGRIERSHCYVVDAAAAVLFVLAEGDCGEAYNIADPAYQMQIREFAEAAAKAGGGRIVFENPNDLEMKGYSVIKRAVLCNEKLKGIGWRPIQSGESKIERTIAVLREDQEHNAAETAAANC